MINRNCLICLKSFKVKPSIIKKGFGKYCSIVCKGRAYKGDGNPKWRGGVLLEKQGYILIYKPNHPYCDKDGYVRQHRLIIEESIKRVLRPKEVVHHKNGIKHDNRIENLELFSSHSEHFKHEIDEGNIPLTYWKGKKLSKEHRDKVVKTLIHSYSI